MNVRSFLNRANPIFAIGTLTALWGGLFYVLLFGSLLHLNYYHILTGGLWTGIDLFMGFVVGPVLGGLDASQRARVFSRLTPRMFFLMPSLSIVAVTAGVELARRLHMLTLGNPWIVAALVIAVILTIQGMGVMLPNEIRVYREIMRDQEADVDKISRLGMINAYLAGSQGILQLAIVYVMANLRF